MKPIESSKQPTSNSQQPTQNGTQPISNLEQIGLNKFTANFTQKSLAASQKIFFSSLIIGQGSSNKILWKIELSLAQFSPSLFICYC